MIDRHRMDGHTDDVASLCHELRQPLVVAVGYVSMLDDGSFGELPEEAKAVLTTIAGRLDAMNAIIDRMAEQAGGRASG